jgi:hypothetical protein
MTADEVMDVIVEALAGYDGDQPIRKVERISPRVSLIYDMTGTKFSLLCLLEDLSKPGERGRTGYVGMVGAMGDVEELSQGPPEYSQEGQTDYYYLCCNCGVITPYADWTAWFRDPEYDGPEVEAPLTPAPMGWQDPIMRCPSCSWDHVDDDSGPGIYDGTKAAMLAERTRLVVADYEWPRQGMDD